MKYDFQAIEKKWQARWETEKPFAAVTGDPRPKFYGLIEFPYPSGQGLHVGHPRPFTAMDIICRKRRMQGSLCPAFFLPILQFYIDFTKPRFSILRAGGILFGVRTRYPKK